MIQTVPVSEAKQRIRELMNRVEQDGDIFYVSRYSRPKAVMMGVLQYETLLARTNRLEEELAQLWLSLNEQSDGPLMVPTADGKWRLFEPSRPISPETRAAIRRAARIAWDRRWWTRDKFVATGERTMERARADAIAQGISIADDSEAAIGD